MASRIRVSGSKCGLLTKRADLFNEAERIRDRMVEIKNDIALGYTGDLDGT